MNYSTFIGIDVSKLTFDAFVHHKNHKKAFKNNQKGFSALKKWIENDVGADLSGTLICFEHTGLYSLNLSLFFQQASTDFVMVPALEIKRSLGTTRGKNDEIDARRIAEYAYLRREQLKPTLLPPKAIMKLQPLLALRDNLVTDRAQYQAIRGEQKLVFDQKDNRELFDTYDRILKDISMRIAEIELTINQVLQSDKDIRRTFELLNGIKGIGPLTAAYLIIYTHNFTRFDSWRKFACYSGIAPFEYSSGTSVRGRTKVSHLANKHIKSLLFLAANNAVRYDQELKLYYQRRLKEGKSKMSTLNIVKNKLVARAFAVAKRRTEYVTLMQFAA